MTSAYLVVSAVIVTLSSLCVSRIGNVRHKNTSKFIDHNLDYQIRIILGTNIFDKTGH